MNKISFAALAVLLMCSGAIAQDATPPGDAGPKVFMFQSNAAATNGPVTTSGMFFTAESAGNGKVITSAPYTATATTEMIQVLGDGNRIVNKSTASLARDSEGRTRREQAMGNVGPWQVNGPTLVFINDPVSRTNYVLDPTKQTASAMKAPSGAGLPPLPPLPPVQSGMNVTYMTQGGGGGPVATIVARSAINGQQDEVKTESLGVQTMEGVSVEGKRITRTIPAGQIGNVQPIVNVSEVWFSPDLQVVVMSKHSDPRFGDTVYQLSGIQRSEPDPSLFQIPAGYTVQNNPTPQFLRANPNDGSAPQAIGGAMVTAPK